MLVGVERSRRLSLITLQPFLTHLCRQFGILSISKPYRIPRPVTGMALVLLYFMLHETHGKIFTTITENPLPLMKINVRLKINFLIFNYALCNEGISVS
jgi:hypothetical protein